MPDLCSDFLQHYKPPRLSRKGTRVGRAANPYCSITDSHYTTQELNILRQHYAIGGAKEVHKHLPTRSIHSIHKRAEKLGIRFGTRTGATRWDEEENNILEMHIDKPNREIVEIFKSRGFARSFHSIRSKKPQIRKKLCQKQQSISS